MAEIEIHYPDGLVGYRTLSSEASLIIGKDAECDVQLEAGGIKPKHCVIRWHRNAFRVEVADGVKNVLIDGEPVRKATLRPNEGFTIGAYRFILRAGKDEVVFDSMEVDFDMAHLSEGEIVSPEPSSPAREASTYYTPMWQSKTFLGITGGLVLLCLVSLIMFVLVRHASRDKQFDAAMADLSDRQFNQAIQRFDQFLEDFPTGELAEKAIVWRGIARVRQFSDTSTPAWHNALEAAEQFVKEAGDLPFFNERAEDVAGLLVQTAEGLAQIARQEIDTDALTSAIDALELLNDEFPAARQPEEEVDRVRGLIAQARQAIEKEETRQATLRRMDAALSDNNPMQVYKEHRQLYLTYPGHRQDSDCLGRRAKARELEQQQVVFEPSSGQNPAPAAVKVAPARTVYRRSASGAAGNTGGTIAILVADTLFAIEPGTGKVRWRRPIGYEPAFLPRVVPTEPSKMVAHSSRNNSLLLLESETGAVEWSRPITPNRLLWRSQPLFYRGKIYLLGQTDESADTGLLLAYQLADGRFFGNYKFPQPVVTPPVVDSQRDALMIPGEVSSLYSISPAEQRCDRVLGIEHEAGSIRAAPVMVGRFLLVAENQSESKSTLRCYVVSDRDGSATLRQSIDLPGAIWRKPVIRGGRVFAVTDRNHFSVIELGGEEDPQPLTVATRSFRSVESATEPPFMLSTSEREFWTVSREIRFYQIQVTDQRSRPAWEYALPGPAIQPPVAYAGVLTVVYREPRSGIVHAIGFDVRSRTERWHTQFGILPRIVRNDPTDPSAVLVTDEDGAKKVTADQLSAPQLVEKPSAEKNDDGPLEQSVAYHTLWEWTDGVLQWSGLGNDRLLLYQPGGVRRATRLPSVLSARPAVLGQGVLAPGQDAMLYWIDPRSGVELAEPFVGPYTEGRPAPLGPVTAVDAQTVLVVASRSVIRLTLVQKPFPYFKETGRAEFPDASITGLNAVEGKVIMIHGEQILSLRPADLEIIDRRPLGAPVAQPPVMIRSDMLLLTENDEAVCVGGSEAGANVKWRLRLSGKSIGPPTPDNDTAWIAFAEGRMIQLDLADGTIRNEVTVGRAIIAGPWILKDRLVVLTPDGSLASVER